MSTRKRTFTSQSLDPTGPSRKPPTDDTTAPTTAPHRASRVSKIPSPVRFVLVVLSSLVLSSLLFTFASEITEGDLAPVSKHLETWWEVGGLIAWRSVELGLAWILGFDGRDVAYFTLITHLPSFSLLSSFYGIRPTTTLTSFIITLFSTTVPFVLLRQARSVHSLSSARGQSVSNRAILQDRPTAIYTSVAASTIYAVVLYISFATWLPTHLVTHFEGLPDIRTAHAGAAGFPVLFLSLLPAGYAARDFLFVSSAGWSAESDTSKSEIRQDEYLICALYRHTWGALSQKTKILIARTILLATMVVSNTVVQVAGTVKGVDVEGAAGWGAIWAVATLVVGLTFGWIEAVDGV
ncbi:hypothetical protein VTN00DRAFT_1823 [Thermoascus crustaceus]|uniref:uncharacterized protein n=1 Tax=Thermoascus crustaceus TaxID=5088 RepID=UPI00374286E6